MTSNTGHTSVVPLLFVLAGLGTAIATCAVLLFPHSVYRWLRLVLTRALDPC